MAPLRLAFLFEPTFGWSHEPLRDASSSALIITLDTTRADPIGAYVHAQAETPPLATSGPRFSRACSSAPRSIPLVGMLAEEAASMPAKAIQAERRR